MRWYGVGFNLSLEEARNDLARGELSGMDRRRCRTPPSLNLPLTGAIAKAQRRRRVPPDLVLENSSIRQGPSEVLFFRYLPTSTPPLYTISHDINGCQPFIPAVWSSWGIEPALDGGAASVGRDLTRSGLVEVHQTCRVLASRMHLFFEGFQKQQGYSMVGDSGETANLFPRQRQIRQSIFISVLKIGAQLLSQKVGLSKG
jgi:hypothetical protein